MRRICSTEIWIAISGGFLRHCCYRHLHDRPGSRLRYARQRIPHRPVGLAVASRGDWEEVSRYGSAAERLFAAAEYRFAAVGYSYGWVAA